MDTHGTSELSQTRGTDGPCDISVRTAVFRLSPAEYLTVSYRRLLPRLISIMALPIIICGIAALTDIRWALVGLIILFLVYPMAMAYIYFSKLLTVEAQQALCPKRVTVSANRNLHIVYEPPAEEIAPPPAKEVSATDITSARQVGRHIVFTIPSLGYPLLIPLSALPRRYDTYNLCSSYGDDA